MLLEGAENSPSKKCQKALRREKSLLGQFTNKMFFKTFFLNSKKVTLNSHITKVIIIAFITNIDALVFPLGITVDSCTFNQHTAHIAAFEILPTY